MAKFILLFQDQAEAASDLTPDDVRAIVGEFSDWAGLLREQGRLLGGEKLTGERGRFMRSRDGEIQVMDGPFAETKELLSGFIMIEADDYDAAVEISRSCPQLKYGGGIEIRRIDEVH